MSRDLITISNNLWGKYIPFPTADPRNRSFSHDRDWHTANVESYTWVFDCAGELVPPTLMLFKNQLCNITVTEIYRNNNQSYHSTSYMLTLC